MWSYLGGFVGLFVGVPVLSAAGAPLKPTNAYLAIVVGIAFTALIRILVVSHSPALVNSWILWLTAGVAAIAFTLVSSPSSILAALALVQGAGADLAVQLVALGVFGAVLSLALFGETFVLVILRGHIG